MTFARPPTSVSAARWVICATPRAGTRRRRAGATGGPARAGAAARVGRHPPRRRAAAWRRGRRPRASWRPAHQTEEVLLPENLDLEPARGGGPLAEALDGPAVPRLGEEGPDGRGDTRSDAVDLGDLRLAGLLEAVHAAEARGQELRRALADHADAEAVETAGGPARLRGLDGVVGGPRRFVRPPGQGGGPIH